MKKLLSVLTLAFLFSIAFSSCKSHGGCAAYSKADAPVKNTKAL